jgi:CDP-diacylglycerol--serine O-phosphatidyltransferase
MNIKKYKIVIPSMVTSISITCGIFAIFFCLHENTKGLYHTIPCWLIIVAAFMDLVDGKVARLTRTSSEFGIQFDTIADVITFGTATSVILYKNIFIHYIAKNPVFFLFPIVFLICGAIRLAKFNISATTKSKSGFTGLPIPGAAGALVSILLFFNWMDNHDYFIPQEIILRIIIFYTILVSFLMVSTLRCETFIDFFFGDLKKHIIRSIINTGIVILLFIYPSLAFFAVSAFYILYSIAGGLRGLSKFKKSDNGKIQLQEDTHV